MEAVTFSVAVREKMLKAAEILRAGGVIICPTEGLYGISALADREGAVKRIIEMKRRSVNKGLILVTDSTENCTKVADLSQLSSASLQMLHDNWPGHNTFILPAASSLSPLLTGGRNTVAVRVTAFPLLAELCRLAGGPLVSTSANISGEETLTDTKDLVACFGNSVDFILDEPCEGKKTASRIFDAVSGKLLRG